MTAPSRLDDELMTNPANYHSVRTRLSSSSHKSVTFPRYRDDDMSGRAPDAGGSS